MIGTLLSLFLTAAPAKAPASYSVEIGGTDAEPSCKRAVGVEPVSAAEVVVTVTGQLDNGDPAPVFTRIKVGSAELKMGDAISRRALAASEGKAMLVLVREGAEPVRCGEQTLFAKLPAEESEKKTAAPEGEAGVDTRLDAQAQAWWAENVEKPSSKDEDEDEDKDEDKDKASRASVVGAQLLKKVWEAKSAGSPRGLGHKKAVLLTHLPSGAPASPFPSSVREGALVQVAVIRPTSGDGALVSYRLEVESCAAVEPFRLKGGAVKQPDSDKYVKEGGPLPVVSDSFEVVPIGQWMRCGAGPFEYKLIPSNAEGTGFDEEAATDATLRVREVHHLAATATVGFDAAQLPTFGLRASDDGTGQRVTEGEEYGGLRVLLGAQWMIGGVDYEDMRWYNYFANLFVAVDVAKPLDGATFGLALTPTGGISLALGVSLSKTRHLGNGMEVGDPFTGEGDVPVETDWRDPGVGPFIGLTIDHHLYQALVAKFR